MGKSIKEAITGDSLLLALMYILIGIVMLAFGNGSIDFIFWITGVIMIIFGILQIVLESTDIKGGLITIVIGIIVIILSWTPIDTILVGIILILHYFMNRKAYRDDTVPQKQVNVWAVAGVVLGAVVANLVKWGVPAINGMAVASICFLAGQLTARK